MSVGDDERCDCSVSFSSELAPLACGLKRDTRKTASLRGPEKTCAKI